MQSICLLATYGRVLEGSTAEMHSWLPDFILWVLRVASYGRDEIPMGKRTCDSFSFVHSAMISFNRSLVVPIFSEFWKNQLFKFGTLFGKANGGLPRLVPSSPFGSMIFFSKELLTWRKSVLWLMTYLTSLDSSTRHSETWMPWVGLSASTFSSMTSWWVIYLTSDLGAS